MKPLGTIAVVLCLFAVGCDAVLSPATPSGVTTLVSQLSGSQEVPAATAPEAASAGSVSVSMTPTGGGAYAASFTIQVGGLVKAVVLPAPLDSGSVIVAGHIHPGAAGVVGAPVVPLPISQAAPIVTPTGSVFVTISNVAVPADVASAILANPSGYYFNLHSALNPGGVVRGQLIKQ
ncbi:MAG: CHRD domain-containing protein [Acidobacteria bacterium]|nr:CHRD domain-containing protein [Acidobacteriota bacterium]